MANPGADSGPDVGWGGVPDDRREAVARMLRGHVELIEGLRRVPLPYVPDPILPSAALEWLSAENWGAHDGTE
jgi:hypothetical protein